MKAYIVKIPEPSMCIDIVLGESKEEALEHWFEVNRDNFIVED